MPDAPGSGVCGQSQGQFCTTQKDLVYQLTHLGYNLFVTFCLLRTHLYFIFALIVPQPRDMASLRRDPTVIHKYSLRTRSSRISAFMQRSAG